MEEQRSKRGHEGRRVERDANDEEIDMVDLPKEMPTASADVVAQRRMVRVRRNALAPTPTAPSTTASSDSSSLSANIFGGQTKTPPKANPFASFGNSAALSPRRSVEQTESVTTTAPASVPPAPFVTETPKEFKFTFGATPAWSAATSSNNASSNSEDKPKTFSFSFATEKCNWAQQTPPSTATGTTTTSTDTAPKVTSPKPEEKSSSSLVSSPTSQKLAPVPVTTHTGEEDEKTLYVCQVKAYLASPEKQWIDIGAGDLKVNKANDGKSSRIILREEKTKRITVNAPLGQPFALGGLQGKAFHFIVTTPEGRKSYLLKQTSSMTRGSLEELYKQVEALQKEALLNS
eukprot:PhF_6_TR33019/c0_g1_i1/m.48665